MRKRYEICQELKTGERKSLGIRLPNKTLAEEALQAYVEANPKEVFVVMPVIDERA